MKTPTEKILERLPVKMRKHPSEDIHVQYVVRPERKLIRLSGHPDVCAEKSGEWVFMEVSITRPLCIEKVP